MRSFSRLHIGDPEIPHANSSEAASRALHTFSQTANVFVPRPREAKGQQIGGSVEMCVTPIVVQNGARNGNKKGIRSGVSS